MSSPDPFYDLPESSGVVPAVDSKKAARRGNGGAGQAVLDRLPPHSPEAEQGILGSIMSAPNDCLPLAITKFPSGDEVFYDLRHQTIYANMAAMYEARKPVDLITLMQRLKDFGMLEEIGGIPYLNQLQDSVPSAANVTNYIEIVLEKYLLRKMLSTCTEIVGKAYDCEDTVETFIDESERQVLEVRRGITNQSSSFGMKETTSEAMQEIEAIIESKGAITGIRTGFFDLDRMTGGLNGGEMHVIAARPSLGKTSLAMNIAEFVSVDNKIPVGVFSLEMTRNALTRRMICCKARVNLRDVNEGFVSDAMYPKLASAAGAIRSCPMRIDDTAGLSIMQLRARARMMWQMYGIKLFIVDYLQLLCSSTKRGRDNRQQEVSEISSGLKSLAKELNVPIIVLSQLNREIDKTKRKPQLSDLRESGSIEQDADLVGFLYNASNTEEEYNVVDYAAVNLKIAKQRNGPTGEVNLTFLKSYTRFESAAKVNDEDQPPTQQAVTEGNYQPEFAPES